MNASQPETYRKVLAQTIKNVILRSTGVLQQTTGKNLSTPRDVELSDAEIVDRYKDLKARGILQIMADNDEIYESNWVDQLSDENERATEKLGLV